MSPDPTPPRSVFILVRSDWRYHDDFYTGDYAFVRGYATREEAEAAIPGRPLGPCFGRAEQSYEVVEVPVDFVDRTHGDSKLGLRDVIEFIWNAWWIRFQASRTFIKFLIVGATGVIVNLGVFTILASLLFHNFWAVAPEQQMVQQLMFMKNLAVAGGMFVVAALGAGPLSIDNRGAATAGRTALI